MPVHDFNTIVYKTNDNRYICEDKYGKVLAHSTTSPETVLQTSLNRAGDIKWYDAQYNMSNSFSGLFPKSDTSLYTSWGVQLRVPQGYDGGCLVIDPEVNGGTVRKLVMNGGLDMNEQGSVQKLWDGLQFAGNHETDGFTFSDVGNIHISNAHRGIGFIFNTLGAWITTVKFRNIIAYYTDILAETEVNVEEPVLGFSSCNFDYVSIQSYHNTYFGWKNIRGNNNLWTNCTVWDVQDSRVGNPLYPEYPLPYPEHPGGVVSAEFTSDSTNSYVLGGIMLNSKVINNAYRGELNCMVAHGAISMWDTHKFTYAVNGPTDGSKTINIPHGMKETPDFAWVFPLSSDAAINPFRVTNKNSTNITITYEQGTAVPATLGNQNNCVYEVWVSRR